MHTTPQGPFVDTARELDELCFLRRYLQKLAADAGIPSLTLQMVKSAAAPTADDGADDEHSRLQALLWEHFSKLTEATTEELYAIAIAAGVEPSDAAEAVSKNRQLDLLELITALGALQLV